MGKKHAEHATSFLESMRDSPAYAPVGMLLAGFAWYAIKVIIDQIPCVDVGQLKRTLLALLFSGVYIYTWIQGANPHDAEVATNELVNEIPLLLAGGYYLLNAYPQSCPSTTLHHVISAIGVILVINSKKGAGTANTFGFLVEAPNVFLALRGCVAKLEMGTLDTILNVVYPLIFILAKMFTLGHLSYLILTNEQVEIPLKITTFVLAMFSLVFLTELICAAFQGFYIYLWVEGANPNEVNVKKNELYEEIPLLLAGGYYMFHMLQKNISSVQSLLDFVAMWIVLALAQGANIAITVIFLTEAPNVLMAMRGCTRKSGIVSTIIPILSVLVVICCNLEIWYINYLVMSNDKIPGLLKGAVVAMSLGALFKIADTVGTVMSLGGSRRCRRRSRSCSRSRSRNRSRSRGCRVRRRC